MILQKCLYDKIQVVHLVHIIYPYGYIPEIYLDAYTVFIFLAIRLLYMIGYQII